MSPTDFTLVATRRCSWPVVSSLFATAFAAVPLALTQPAPLEDWPSHIARVKILAALIRGGSDWGQYYQLNQILLPNSALDFGITLLHLSGLPLGLAAQMFLLLTFVLFVSGGVALARAADASDPIKPMLFAVLFYNGALMGGFVNFMTGLGGALWMLAFWIGSPALPARRALIATSGAALIFFAHLIAACFFVAVVGLLELEQIRRSGRLGLATLLRHSSAALAGCVVVLLLTLSPTSNDTLSSHGAHSIIYVGAPSIINILKGKLILLGHPILDGSGIRGAAVLVAGLIALGCIMAGASRLRLTPRILWLTVGLNGLWLIAPNGVGVGYGLDYRLVPSMLVVLIAATPIEWRSVAGRQWALAVVLVFSVCRTASFMVDFRSSAETFRAFQQATAAIVPDSVLLTAIGTQREAIPWAVFWSPPTEYLPTTAVERGVFVPTTFALAAQHSVVLKSPYRGWTTMPYLANDAMVAAGWPLFDQVCKTWRADGHRGGVYLSVVYPSAYSDGLSQRAPVIGTGAGFRLMTLCGE